MKFYKLELINREHSYNQMFGKTPAIGHIQALAANSKPPINKTKNSMGGVIPVQSKKVL
jgi:hypothetical protein